MRVASSVVGHTMASWGGRTEARLQKERQTATHQTQSRMLYTAGWAELGAESWTGLNWAGLGELS